MEPQVPELVDWDTLCAWEDPTHMIKSWRGAIDPVHPLQHVSMQDDIDQGLVHDDDFHFLGMLRSVPQFVDIGANCGQSITSYRTLNPDTPVISFEPNPICYRIMNMYGGMLPKVRTYPFGLSSSSGFMDLYTPVVDRLLVTPLATTRQELYQTGAGVGWLEQNSHGRRTAIYAERLAFLQGDAFDLTPGVLKIDVEGGELQTLHGLTKTILTHRPVIMVENSNFLEVMTFMNMLNYSPWQWVDGILSEMDVANPARWGSQSVNTIYIHGPDVERHARDSGFDIRKLDSAPALA